MGVKAWRHHHPGKSRAPDLFSPLHTHLLCCQQIPTSEAQYIGFAPRSPASGQPVTRPRGALHRSFCGRRWRTSATVTISQLDNCCDFFLFLGCLLSPLLQTFERAAAFLVESSCPEQGITLAGLDRGAGVHGEAAAVPDKEGKRGWLLR
uniref:Uncharacterized protein n=1 Tax=Pelusios castaneus TaxID=367368 RepID=A0A8C8S9T2_9SAUR